MIWEILFWLFFGLIVYTYLGYPLLLILFTAFKQKYSFYDSNHKPHVSLIISSINEEKIIRQKIENALNLQYPKNKLSIVVASDAIEKLVRHFSDRNVGCVCGELSYWNQNGSGKSIERIQGLTHDPNIYGSSLVYLFIDSFSQHCFYLYNSIPYFGCNWVVQVQ